MKGLGMEELYELISYFHEAEFKYKGTTYMLQPEFNENDIYLVIWDCTPNAAKCIAKHKVTDKSAIPFSVIDSVLSEKCFDGKSFMEIEADILVTTVY